MIPAFFEIFMAMVGAMMSGASILAQDNANKQNIALAKETLNQQQKFSEEAAETAQQRQIDMYKQFFSPEAMTQQYREAGLNPSLIYAKGGVGGNSTAGAQATTPTAAVPYINPLLGQGQMAEMMNVLKTMTEAENTQAGTKKIEEEVKNLAKMREKIDQEIKQSESEIKLLEQKCNTEVASQNLMKMNTKLAEIDAKYKDADWQTKIDLMSEQKNVLKDTQNKIKAEIEGLDIDNKNKQKLYTATMRQINAQTNLMVAQKGLTMLQQLNVEADTKLKEYQQQLVEAQTKLANQKTTESKYEVAKIEKECQELTQKIENLKAAKELCNEQTELVSKQIEEYNYKLESMNGVGYNSTVSTGLIETITGGVKDIVNRIF